MPRGRIAMHHIEEIMRLRHEAGRTQREIASSCGMAQSSVHRVLAQAKAAGLGWPLPEGLDEPALHELLFGRPAPLAGGSALPDRAGLRVPAAGAEAAQALDALAVVGGNTAVGNRAVTGNSRFCDLYRKWRKKQHLVMRQEHRAGEKVLRGLRRGQGRGGRCGRRAGRGQAQVFVAVLGASSYTYAEASWSQELGSWIDSHVRGLPVLPGLPRGVRAGQSSLRCHARLPVPAGTEPVPTGRWRVSMASLWSRRARESLGTRPRRNPECSWWNAGSWRRCGTSGSRAWAS